MEICPLMVSSNFERNSMFSVLKASVAAEIMAYCLQNCKRYAKCQPEFELLPKSGAYIVETLSSELGHALVEI